MMDRKIVQAEAANLCISGPLDSPGDLDRVADDLIQQLRRIADLSTPRRRTGYGYRAPW